jgi:hypothetical protein
MVIESRCRAITPVDELRNSGSNNRIIEIRRVGCMNPSDAMERQLDERLNWAREQLGVSAHASPDEVRTRFFAVLEQSQMAPDKTLDIAFRTLRWEAEGVIVAEEPAEFLASRERRLYELVKQFRNKMFSLPVAERRQHWCNLRRESETVPSIHLRLEALEVGLDVDLAVIENSAPSMHVAALARYATELFTLQPIARATRRGAILQSFENRELKAWRKAAQVLKKRHPQIATLAPELIDLLASGKQPSRTQRSVHVHTSRRSPRRESWALSLAVIILIAFIVRAAMIQTKISVPARSYGPQSPYVPWPPQTRLDSESNPWSHYPAHAPPIDVAEILKKHREELDRIRQENETRMRETLNDAPFRSADPTIIGIPPVSEPTAPSIPEDFPQPAPVLPKFE